MGSRFGWALAVLMSSSACGSGSLISCGGSSGSGSGSSSSTTTGADSVNVRNCSNYQISVFHRKGSGPWSQDGFMGTFKLPNGLCNHQAVIPVNADLGTGVHTVRVVYENNCDAGDPDGSCIKTDSLWTGNNSAPVRIMTVSLN